MFSDRIHRYIFLFGIIALAFGMMMGTVPTSVPQILLMCNWLLEGDFKRKWLQLRDNTLFWILSSVFLLHAFGLFYSSDLSAGWDDVRTKIPLMFLPLLFLSSKPLERKEYETVFYFFMAGCVTNTLWCMTYSFVWHQNEVVRDASRFMSHIRLGLYLVLAICCAVFFFITTASLLKRGLMMLLIVYFIFSLYALGLASGMINFAILLFLFLCVIIYKQKGVLKIASFLVLLLFCLMTGGYVWRVKGKQLDIRSGINNTVTSHTPGGRPYIHFDTLGQKENGNYVLINIQLEELQREWKRRALQDSFSYAPEYNLERYEVLVRYLASKGLNKDSAAVASLSEEDIQNVRKGIFNYLYPSWSFFHRRIYELVNEFDEYKNGRHVNGHSLTMRLYFWEAGMYVAQKNLCCGVGTGDVQQALNAAYLETRSPLHQEWYKRPHNQFLTITVALGILGLFVFVLSLIYPSVTLRQFLPILYWPFLIIALVSFMVEDTLETQAGLSFFAFFNSLFLSQAYHARQKV